MGVMKRAHTGIGSLVLVILVAGILAAVNVISQRVFFRIDLTKDERYSIAGATKDVLRGSTTLSTSTPTSPVICPPISLPSGERSRISLPSTAPTPGGGCRWSSKTRAMIP